MKSEDLLEEYEWFREAGIHPMVIVETLGKQPEAVVRAFQRMGRYDLAREVERKWNAEVA
jgi:hypothetical protein